LVVVCLVSPLTLRIACVTQTLRNKASAQRELTSLFQSKGDLYTNIESL